MSLSIIIPLIGAVALGTGTILEKIILRKRKINIKLFQTTGFLAIILVMLPLLYFFWEFDTAALSTKNILIMFGVVTGSIIANILVFYAMKWEKITNIEPARLVEPLFTIGLAIIFSFIFGEALFERNTKVIIPAMIAGVALIFSHIKKHHLEFNKYFIAAIIGSFFFAFELVLSRLILDFYSPITFYFIRSTLVFLISFIIFQPHFSKLNSKIRWEILIIGAIWVLFRVLVYYGYLNYGVIFTTLILMLGPVFIYLFAWKFLKEKISWRNLVAAGIIIAAVLYTLLG
ncbi:MAG: DMT family transporter [Nanoarchaeota archaeon]|nr:DMT family transporter [Nanoarchaeota archaeon]MBU1027714.1 DMT family transporter [Nanoarchaeota archaeon]